jgi:hypothetical protein
MLIKSLLCTFFQTRTSVVGLQMHLNALVIMLHSEEIVKSEHRMTCMAQTRRSGYSSLRDIIMVAMMNAALMASLKSGLLAGSLDVDSVTKRSEKQKRLIPACGEWHSKVSAQRITHSGVTTSPRRRGFLP